MKTRTGRALPILGLIGLMGGVAGFTLARLAGWNVPAEARWLVFLATVVPAVWLTRLYWLRIDEAAREAQKTAWFWGGSIGAVVGFALMMMQGARDLTFWGLVPPDASPIVFVQAGAFGVVLGQLAGFFIGWAIWWWRMR
ncbi:hypothetical protein ACO2Q0_17360 [Phenylobacterium sp. VNQ135]|uniref:hypothetical protein n=1 Tax=Phenylobacterium sp. VNQ135 TaxID=3400922 RepID=UPI003BFB47F4